MMQLVLASTSPFRQQLLAKLGLDFVTAAPDIDERQQAGETPEQLVQRLAHEKACAVASRYPHALIIGSDQVACLDEAILGKPGNRENAIEQLRQMAARTVVFYTGLCVLNSQTGQARIVCEPFKVHFRPLRLEQITRYVDKEQPFNCAGSFKSEGLGITLFRKLEGNDPNALIGLPLIRLTDLLAQQGIQLP